MTPAAKAGIINDVLKRTDNFTRSVGSVGRAPCSHRGGHWFESNTDHFNPRPVGRGFFFLNRMQRAAGIAENAGVTAPLPMPVQCSSICARRDVVLEIVQVIWYYIGQENITCQQISRNAAACIILRWHIAYLGKVLPCQKKEFARSCACNWGFCMTTRKTPVTHMTNYARYREKLPRQRTGRYNYSGKIQSRQKDAILKRGQRLLIPSHYQMKNIEILSIIC